jgi:hypothetical protein
MQWISEKQNILKISFFGIKYRNKIDVPVYTLKARNF